MPVDYQHSSYKTALPLWTAVVDVCAGEARVKSKKEVYLPKPNPDDLSESNKKRYEQYLKRAVFYNVTRRTLTGLIGAATKDEPELDLPSQLAYMASDINGQGVGIAQQAHSVLSAVVQKGRHGLLVDYPQVEQVSVADAERMAIRPTIIEYDAENIVNWRCERIGGAVMLTLVVLAEMREKTDPDGFGASSEVIYRVLRLVAGAYQQEVWTKIDKGDWIMESASTPRQANGSTWNVIPFTFVGSVNNDPDIDPSPLYDLASLNLAHYRNSADYEDSVFFTGQVQPWIAGLSEEWRDHLESEGIYIGSRSPILLPDGGSFGFAQAAPNTLCGEAMDKKEAQMAALGARLLESGGAVKTATEAQGEMESEYSVLSMCAMNVNKAYEKCLEWAGMFVSVSGQAVFKLATDYVESKLDPQMIAALVQLWQTGKYPTTDFWSQLRQYNLIPADKDDEAIQDDLDTEVPTSINLDAATGQPNNGGAAQ